MNMQTISTLLALPLFQNAWTDWSLANVIATGTLLGLVLLRRIGRGYHKRLLATAPHTRAILDCAITLVLFWQL